MGSIKTIGLSSFIVSVLFSLLFGVILLFKALFVIVLVLKAFFPPFIEAIGIRINTPTNTAIKSTTAIPVVINKSKNNNIATLIPNKIQKVFFELSLEIILDNGISTNIDICIETNASIPYSPC